MGLAALDGPLPFGDIAAICVIGGAILMSESSDDGNASREEEESGEDATNPDDSNLTKEQQKAIRSHEKRIKEHEEKLIDFEENPTVRPGMEGQPKEVIEKQQQARKRHLEKEIQTFKNNIRKIREGG